MMNQLLKTKCTATIPCMLMLLLFAITSCDKEWPDDICDCNNGSTIGGWGEANDTTIVNKNDSIGGFSVTLEEWGNICQQDIPL